mmetsp:Transcript_16260/g.38539  ORF Transcript_16260/g.38539 Transcript_16260/m.38539 type:complete len:222 (+) Transcript_16260:157-822(+)
MRGPELAQARSAWSLGRAGGRLCLRAGRAGRRPPSGAEHPRGLRAGPRADCRRELGHQGRGPWAGGRRPADSAARPRDQSEGALAGGHAVAVGGGRRGCRRDRCALHWIPRGEGRGPQQRRARGAGPGPKAWQRGRGRGGVLRPAVPRDPRARFLGRDDGFDLQPASVAWEAPPRLRAVLLPGGGVPPPPAEGPRGAPLGGHREGGEVTIRLGPPAPRLRV